MYDYTSGNLIDEVMEEIMVLFKNNRTRVGQIISHYQLENYLENLNIIEETLFEEAVSKLVSCGYAEIAKSEIGGTTYRLTALGSDYLY